MARNAVIKHVVPPATAAELVEGFHITEEDRKVVEKVLHRLGYLPKGERLSFAIPVERSSGQQAP